MSKFQLTCEFSPRSDAHCYEKAIYAHTWKLVEHPTAQDLLQHPARYKTQQKVTRVYCEKHKYTGNKFANEWGDTFEIELKGVSLDSIGSTDS